jgi:lysine 2,3-aminomutase
MEKGTGEEPPGTNGRDLTNGKTRGVPLWIKWSELTGRAVTPKQWQNWRWQLQNAVTSLEALQKFIRVRPEDTGKLQKVSEKYPFIIPPYYLSLIDLNDPNDPIRIQSFPSAQELEATLFGEDDPLEEEEDMAVPGLIHRYPDRVLMQITNVCPMNCRHCTRKREWEDGPWGRTNSEIDRMVEYIARTPAIRDVLLSGGDPLILSNQRLEYAVKQLRAIPHLEIIRFGTRFPVVCPQRIDDEFVTLLRKYRPIWVNTHFNHPQEMTDEAKEACDRIVGAGIPMNNQSVLLKGVNDNLETMTKLCHELLKIGVRPYYLYQCDPVRGTEYLRTSVWKGIEIIEGMRGHTTGFAVPTFVVDCPGGGGKIPVGPKYVLEEAEDYMRLRNYEGLVVRYDFPKDEASERHRRNSTPAGDRSKLRERLERRKERHSPAPLEAAVPTRAV